MGEDDTKLGAVSEDHGEMNGPKLQGRVGPLRHLVAPLRGLNCKPLGRAIPVPPPLVQTSML
jgi:hypothetical protein